MPVTLERTPLVRLDYVAPLRWLRRVVFASAASLVVMDVVASYLAGTNRLRGVTRFFDADFKTNCPSSYKILALLTSTIFLWLITEASRITLDRFSRHWRVLAGVFAFLTLDEMTALHQSFSAMLHKEIGGSGYLKYSWQVVYLAALGLLAVYFIPFLHHLGPRMRVRLLAAAILFGGGSGGVEFIKAHLESTGSDDTLSFKLVAAVSDSAEMIGLAILLLLLLDFLTARVAAVSVRLPDGENEAGQLAQHTLDP